MDATKAIARAQRSESGSTLGSLAAELASETYIEAFPNIARDRMVWPIIEKAIRRRFEKERPWMDAWRWAVSATMDGRNAGSIAKILSLYEDRVIEAKRSENASAPRLPERTEAAPASVKKLLSLMADRMDRKITQEQFDREAEALSQGG